MKALIVDVGNSRISSALWEGSCHRPVRDPGGKGLMPPVPMTEAGSWSHPENAAQTREFKESLARVIEDAGSPPVVLVSVVPGFDDHFPDNISPILVDHTCDLPFGLDIPEPARVGADRLCNMAAASVAGLSRALVVDAGTATTFDLLVDGVFIGGLIAPGMAFAARKIGEAAARLDPVPFGPVSWDVGRDTSAAMAAGAWHSGVGGIRYVVAGLLDRYGDMPVVVTGGLGSYFEDSGWYQDPHWTLRGAAILSGLC